VSGGDADATEARIAEGIPTTVRSLLATLWSAGHAAYVVGGALRDRASARRGPHDPPRDWDLATAALPEQTAALFAEAAYENRFGTVGVRRDGVEYQITTLRTDHDYADHRRPHRVEFGTSIEADLARRDFTMNALAWGADGLGAAPAFLDPYSGGADIRAGVIRAVGEPHRRFEEDALRIVRAIRFAATLGWEIEPATLAAIRETARLVRHLSGERIAAELERLLAAGRPSVGLRVLESTGVLAAISPELAAQRGIGQNKRPGEDLWDHTLRTVDAADNRPVVRLAALVHDIGKPATAADGHFLGHETVGAELAAELLERLHVPTATRDRVVHLVRHHMFRYEPAWGDPAVRRFLGKIGPAAVEDLFALREADNEGSAVPRNADDLDELRARIATELASGALLDRSALAVDGGDLMAELGVRPGPELGRLLAALFDRVVENPAMNDRSTLLAAARDLVSDRLSVQLYTVREALAADVDGTLGRLAALGFRQVEPFDLAGFRDRLAPALRAHGLAVPTAHADLLGDKLEAAVDAAAALGVATLIQPSTDAARWTSEVGIADVAAELNDVARRAAGRGVRVGYHNHQFELEARFGDRHGLDLFADHLDPDVVLEVDTYWAMAGGADVPALLRRLGSRVIALHVKDGDGSLDTSRQVAVGRGTLPVREILAAAPDALRIVELDDTAGDRFAAIEASRTSVLDIEARTGSSEPAG
jgi:putative nucleotidyltransferase with HDIG domain